MSRTKLKTPLRSLGLAAILPAASAFAHDDALPHSHMNDVAEIAFVLVVSGLLLTAHLVSRRVRMGRAENRRS